jgi:hypothetical protein
MRDLVESFARFYLAVSLLGVKQATNLFGKSNQSQASQQLEEVTQAAVKQLDSYTRDLFDRADSVEKGILDLTFGAADPANWDIRKFLPKKKIINYGEEWGPMQAID